MEPSECAACTREKASGVCKPAQRNGFCNQAGGRGSPDPEGHGHKNNTAPFSHVSTQCSPCGGYWKGEYIHKAIGDSTTRVDNSVNLTAFSGYSHGQVRS
jgi:hypothetical protein